MHENEDNDVRRARLREKFNSKGISSLSQKEMLEVVLYHIIPNGDVRPVVDKLLKIYKSVSGVFNATYEELLIIPEVEKEVAMFLTDFPHYARYYMEDVEQNAKKFTNRIYDIDSGVQKLKPFFTDYKSEYLVILFLNSRGFIVHEEVIKGSINEVPIYVRDIVGLCIENKADTIIMAHNHTSGNAMPSMGDIKATKEIQFAMDGIQASLADHIVFAEYDYVSFKKSGLIDSIETATQEFKNNMLASIKKLGKDFGTLNELRT